MSEAEQKIPNENAVVAKSNEILPALARFRLQELRLLAYCLSHYDSRKADSRTITANARDFEKLFPIDEKSAFRVIGQAVRGINSKPLFVKHWKTMKIGYARISKTDGSQTLDLQLDAPAAAGVSPANIYKDHASGKKEARPGLENCLRALRSGDTLIVWKLDRLGRNLRHLVNTVEDLSARGVGFKVLSGQGADIDTASAGGKLVFGIFAALAEFERELIRERVTAGLSAARARGRVGGREFSLTKAKVRLAQAAMGNRETVVSDLCRELGCSRATLYRYVGPTGELRDQGRRVLGKTQQKEAHQ